MSLEARAGNPGSVDARYKFLAGEMNPELGIYQLGPRWYDQRIGTFRNVDPLFDLSPEYSPFHYGFNNPMRFVDFTGLQPAEKKWDEECQCWVYEVPEVVVEAWRGTMSVLEWLKFTADLMYTEAMVDYDERSGQAVWYYQPKYFYIDGERYELLYAGGKVPLIRPAVTVFKSSMFRRNLTKLAGLVKDAHAHHVFPKKFLRQFLAKGIDPNNPLYGAWWKGREHLSKAYEYNQAWRDFLFGGAERTSAEILSFARQLSHQYGLRINF